MEYKPVAEMSFLQLPFPVDLVEIGLRDKRSVLCVAKQTSKTFIALKIVQEVKRKSLPGKTALVISENIKDVFMTEFTKAVELQTHLKTTTLVNTMNQSSSDCTISNADLLITTPTDAVHLLKSSIISLEDVNLIILNDCHLVTESNHPYLTVIDFIKSHDHISQPIITGLSSGLCLAWPALVRITLEKMESVFECQCWISSDLVAMNRFGEQPHENVIMCSDVPDDTNDEIQQLSSILTSAMNKINMYIDAAKDTCTCMYDGACDKGLLPILRRHCIVCFVILGYFGSSTAINHAKSIIKEISKMKKRVRNELERQSLQVCEAQLSSMLKYSKTDKPPDVNHLVKNILCSLSVLKTEASSDSTTSTSNKNELTPKMQSEDDKKSVGKVVNNCNASCHGDTPVSIILCQFDQQAAALSFLLNKLVKSNPELAYLRCRHIPSTVIKQNNLDNDAEEVRNDDIRRLIHEGQANVLITSHEVENDIYLGQCKQVIRFGVPESYRSYVRVKKIARTTQAEFIIVESEDSWIEELSKIRYDVGNFSELESILVERCQSRQHAIKPDVLSEDLITCNYEPQGKDGPCVDAKFAIALINRYCKAFPNDGLSFPLPRCRVKVMEKDNQIHVVSRLYLPRHSQVFWPFKGTVTICKDQATPECLAKARIKSSTSAALLACKTLHELGELDDNLEPKTRLNNVTFKKSDENCAAEIADGGQSVEGSAKRRRAYQKKFAAVLMNNLAVAGEPVYIYNISITLSQPDTPESMARSYNVSSSDFSLGILSRNHLPKVPAFLLYGRPGELKVSLTECTERVTLTQEQVALVQRFHQYVYTNIININGDSGEQCFQFEPAKQTFGCYLVLLRKQDLPVEPEQRQCNDIKDYSSLKGSDFDECLDEVALQNLTLHNCKENPNDEFDSQVLTAEDIVETSSDINQSVVQDSPAKRSRIAFDFLENLEQQLGCFSDPKHPTPFVLESSDYELFRGRVITAVYMAKPTCYFVADICYDKNPLSPFPEPSVAASFAEYYKQKYDIDLLEDQPLLTVGHITKRLNILSPRYQDTKGNDLPLPDKNSKRQLKSQIILMPQLCSIHPIPASLWQELLYLPSILYRLEGLLVAEELRQTISLNTGVGSVEWPEDTDIPLLAAGESVGENCAERNFMVNNLQQCEMKGIEETKKQPGPSSTLFLRALTCVGTCDVFSHERLEMYGDSLIKHTVSLNLYCESPFSNVGEISFSRGLRVSNKQLFYLGRALNLPSYIYNSTFKPLVNWYPHGFAMLPSVKTQGRYLELNPLGQEIDLSNIEDEKTESDEEACERSALSVLVDSQSHVIASDKIVADTTEAIIGAYLVTCGFKDTLRVMKWMGLDVRDKKDQDNESPETLKDSLSEHVVDQETSDIDDDFFENSLHLHKECLDSEFKDVEEVLGYSFRNKLLLLQAFTHASYPRDFNRIRTSYEHLEFIGDALLDYLVTRYLFCTHRTMSPGALTDLRSAVVNSYSFAFLAFKYGFHKHLRSLSPTAFRIINTFVVIQDDIITKKIRENPDQIFSSVFIPMDNSDETQEGIEVPKVLADLFEAVIGAVFVDCGQDEEKTWHVVFPLLQATLDHYSENLPMSPVRQLQEMFPGARVSMASMDRSIAGRYTCSLLVQGVGKFKGTGRSSKIARSIAAQRALAHVQSKGEKQSTLTK